MNRLLVPILGISLCAIATRGFGQSTNATASSGVSAVDPKIARAIKVMQAIDQPPSPTAPGSAPRSAGNPGQWHLDTAQKLLSVSVWLKQQGDTVNATKGANLALTHLSTALQLTDASQKAAVGKIYDLQGLVYETGLGQNANAIQAYNAAKVANPKDTFPDSRLAGLGGG